jgi:hypothetical protein
MCYQEATLHYHLLTIYFFLKKANTKGYFSAKSESSALRLI